jgi:hypothetical protein
MRRYQRSSRLPRDITTEEISLRSGEPIQGNEESFQIVRQILELLSQYMEAKRVTYSSDMLRRLILRRNFTRIAHQFNLLFNLDEPVTNNLGMYTFRQIRHFTPEAERLYFNTFNVPFDDDRQSIDLAQ